MTGKMPDSCKKTEAGGLSRRYRNADEETQILQFRISKMIEIPLQRTLASRDPASALHVLPIQQNTDGLFRSTVVFFREFHQPAFNRGGFYGHCSSH